MFVCLQVRAILECCASMPCRHHVEATFVTDPETSTQLMLITHHDVSDYINTDLKVKEVRKRHHGGRSSPFPLVFCAPAVPCTLASW